MYLFFSLFQIVIIFDNFLLPEWNVIYLITFRGTVGNNDRSLYNMGCKLQINSFRFSESEFQMGNLGKFYWMVNLQFVLPLLTLPNWMRNREVSILAQTAHLNFKLNNTDRNCNSQARRNTLVWLQIKINHQSQLRNLGTRAEDARCWQDLIRVT